MQNFIRVHPEKIRDLNSNQLNELMQKLLLEEAKQYGSPVPTVNTEDRAPDGGCDAWSERPARPSHWLGDAKTCWQFKAGEAGIPSKIKGEVLKGIPKQTLREGGRYVLIASGSVSGKKGRQDRLKILKEEAYSIKLPIDKIHVFTSEDLANWCNQHWAVAKKIMNLPSEATDVNEWENQNVHKDRWYPTKELEEQARSVYSVLDLSGETEGVVHVHVRGHPGVGKTRFALEVCKKDSLRYNVLYLPQPENAANILYQANDSPSTTLVLVVDEVQSDQLRGLYQAVQGVPNRLRLMTIGPSSGQEEDTISIEINPFTDEKMREFLSERYPFLSFEQNMFIQNFSGGFIKLASLTVAAVKKSPDLSTDKLLEDSKIKYLLTRMLPKANIPSLYVVAIMENVGWEGKVEQEGQIIAECLKIKWADVREYVEEAHENYHIVPEGGRYRYISPRPLGLLLARRAWKTHSSALKTLHKQLPPSAHKSFYQRIEALAQSPQGKQWAEEEIDNFFDWRAFLPLGEARMWKALSQSNPTLAARAAWSALKGSSQEERLQITGDARRQLVWGLLHLAYEEAPFKDAMLALAYLAEAENETWGNNATREFEQRFSIRLGMTKTPYLMRLRIFDSAEFPDTPFFKQLKLNCLARSVQFGAETGSPIHIRHDRPTEDQGWYPRTYGDEWDCRRVAWKQMENMLQNSPDDWMAAYAGIAGDLVWWVVNYEPLRENALGLMRAIRARFPDVAEHIFRVLQQRRALDKYSEEKKEDMLQLQDEFSDSSLAGRLRRELSRENSFYHHTQNEGRPLDFSSLAQGLLENPQILREQWPYLTSQNAAECVYDFGRALSGIDSQKKIADLLLSLRREDDHVGIILGYFSQWGRDAPENMEIWLDGYEARHPKNGLQTSSLTVNGPATRHSVERLLRLVSTGQPPAWELHFQGIGISWIKNLDCDSLIHLLKGLSKFPDSGGVVIDILSWRFFEKDTQERELHLWEGFAQDALVQYVDTLCRGAANSMRSYHWKKLAKLYVHKKHFAVALCRGIFDTLTKILSKKDIPHVPRFLRESDGAEVLRSCIQTAPQETWEIIRVHLEDELVGYPLVGFALSNSFSNGISGLLDDFPTETVLAWATDRTDAEEPSRRPWLLCFLLPKPVATVGDDDTLSARFLDRFGHLPEVREQTFSFYFSGGYSGPSSLHYTELAKQFEALVQRTKLECLRAWAKHLQDQMERIAEHEAKRDAEHALGRW